MATIRPRNGPRDGSAAATVDGPGLGEGRAHTGGAHEAGRNISAGRGVGHGRRRRGHGGGRARRRPGAVGDPALSSARTAASVASPAGVVETSATCPTRSKQFLPSKITIAGVVRNATIVFPPRVNGVPQCLAADLGGQVAGRDGPQVADPARRPLRHHDPQRARLAGRQRARQQDARQARPRRPDRPQERHPQALLPGRQEGPGQPARGAAPLLQGRRPAADRDRGVLRHPAGAGRGSERTIWYAAPRA